MIHNKIIFRILGSLLIIEAVLLALSGGVSLIDRIYFGRGGDLASFVVTIAISLLLAVIFKWLGRHANNIMSRRDGYVVVTITWILFSLVGMLPYIVSGYIPSITDAFFETMSGFTTTGASILDRIETLPRGLLFWRSLTQWIGGLGIVFFTIAILPSMGMGDVKLFSAEATGPTHERLHPRINTTAKWLYTIYITLTLACTGCLWLEGMSLYESACHAMTCAATGGFSTRQESILSFHSPSIEYTLSIFMFLAGTNFTLLYLLFFKRNPRKFFADTELKWYLGIVLTATILCTLIIHHGGMTAGWSTLPPTPESLIFPVEGQDWESSFRHAFFQVVSLQTSTGYYTDDYMRWPAMVLPGLICLMIIGACSGSTSGGMKTVRIAMLFKFIRNEFKRILHPNAVLPVRISGNAVDNSTKTTLLCFAFLYICIIFVSWVILCAMGLDFMEGISVALSSLSNVGPSFGSFGPTVSWHCLPEAAKWFCSLLMLIGRLEMFSVLVIFYPAFWTKR